MKLYQTSAEAGSLQLPAATPDIVEFTKVPVIFEQLEALVNETAPEQSSFAGATADPVIQILKPFAELEVVPVGLKVIATLT